MLAQNWAEGSVSYFTLSYFIAPTENCFRHPSAVAALPMRIGTEIPSETFT